MDEPPPSPPPAAPVTITHTATTANTPGAHGLYWHAALISAPAGRARIVSIAGPIWAWAARPNNSQIQITAASTAPGVSATVEIEIT